jgi:hypothetical protein
LQNWNIGSQSAFDVHEPNGRASRGAPLPESLGTRASGSEQLATLVLLPAHVDVGAGKFAALHVLTGEPPMPQV